jgi:hypothetical protein
VLAGVLLHEHRCFDDDAALAQGLAEPVDRHEVAAGEDQPVEHEYAELTPHACSFGWTAWIPPSSFEHCSNAPGQRE